MPPSIIRVRQSKSFPYTEKKAFVKANEVSLKISTNLMIITGKTSEL